MRINIKQVVLIGLLAFIATGCASREYKVSIEEDDSIFLSPDKEKIIYFAAARAKRTNSADIFIGSSEESFWLLFQAVSDKTLKSGNNYFAIYKPRYLSNVDGVHLHTMGKVKHLCVDKQSRSMIDKLSVFDWSSLNALYCNAINSNSGFSEFIMFKNKPENLDVYNAQEVQQYLKDNGHYADEIIYEETVGDITYSNEAWSEKQRDFWPKEGGDIPFPDENN